MPITQDTTSEIIDDFAQEIQTKKVKGFTSRKHAD